MKYFMSMRSTFRSLVEGKIALDDLRQATLVVGPHKDAINSDAAIPSFVLSFNTEKPKYSDADYVDAASVDGPVAEKWLKFKLVVREAVRENRVQWTDGKHYPGKARPLMEAGHEVYFDGRWMRLGETNYLAEE